MKSARQMFEELGYRYYEDVDFIDYLEIKDKSVKYRIVFWKFNEAIELIPKLNGKDHYFTRIDMKLLKAINKQVEELGWNE